MTVDKILEAAAKIFRQRNRIYNNGYLRHGDVMKALFPDGIVLKTAEDFTRFHLLDLIVIKLNRYTEQFHFGGHPDSCDDSINYWAMLKHVDEKET